MILSRRSALLLLAVVAAVATVVAIPRADPRREAQALLDAWTTAVTDAPETAWARLATEGYRRHTPELVFVTGQRRNAEALGLPERLRLTPDPLHTTRDADGGEVLRAVVIWQGQRASARAVFDLRREDDALRVHRTWAWPEHGLAHERVF